MALETGIDDGGPLFGVFRCFRALKTRDWNANGCHAIKMTQLSANSPLMAHTKMESFPGDLAILAGSGNPQFAKRIAVPLV